MSDLISRDEVLALLCSTCAATDPNNPYQCTKDDNDNGCPEYEAILKLRSISDRHSIFTWEKADPEIPGLYMCTNCRRVIYTTSNVNQYKYCPFCGERTRY